MYNFVIFSLSRWNIEYGCNIKDISIELAKKHRVLFVDVPLKRKERWFQRNAKKVIEVEERMISGSQLMKVSDNLWHWIDTVVLESVNGIKNHFIFDIVNKVNNKRFAEAINRAVMAVGFDNYILLNDNEIYNGFYLKEFLKPSLYVYYLRDRLPAMEYWKRHAGRLEPSLIGKVDLVVANSQFLTDYASEFNSKSNYVGQGCDIDHFLYSPVQDVIDPLFEGISKPIIGYIGALNSERLDIDMLEQLVQRMSGFSFVFVGKEDSRFKSSKLHSFSNVHFKGQQNYLDLPKYLYGFDVAINPQALNEITIGNYPRKVDEYLAAGKPVVATETRAMHPFRNFVSLAKNSEEYESMITAIITEDNQTKSISRRQFAAEHTWANNVSKILDSINKIWL